MREVIHRTPERVPPGQSDIDIAEIRGRTNRTLIVVSGVVAGLVSALVLIPPVISERTQTAESAAIECLLTAPFESIRAVCARTVFSLKEE